MLNKGDCYQVKANNFVPVFDNNPDINGALVTSDKPIAVYAGHECAQFPITNSACDHNIEQMFPQQMFDQTFYTIPFGGDPQDWYIVVSDTAVATKIYVNGTLRSTLAPGSSYGFWGAGVQELYADHPVTLTEFVNFSSGCAGDPSQVGIPPQKSYLNGFTFCTPDVVLPFDCNYVNVIVPDVFKNRVILDGVPVAASKFTTIPKKKGTGLTYAGGRLTVAQGAHTVTYKPMPPPDSMNSMVGYAYGYYSNDSYGYSAGYGTRFEPIIEIDSSLAANKKIKFDSLRCEPNQDKPIIIKNTCLGILHITAIDITGT